MTRRVTRWHSGCPETICGKGSRVSETKEVRALLAALAQELHLKSVADVGCGDQNWVKLVDWDVQYDGYDLEHCGESFDCTKDVLPKPYDMVMMIYVLNHLYGMRDFDAAIRNLVASGSKLLFCTFCEQQMPELPLIGCWHHKRRRRKGETFDWNYGLFLLQGESNAD